MGQMQRQMTATVYIISEDKVLLLYHKKLRKWLPPGGHLDANETPPECAMREAREETGLEVELIPQENVWINRPNANSFERPFLCLLEEIPPHGEQPAHQHVDFIYVAKPVEGGTLTHNKTESDALSWYTWEEVEALKDDQEIFLDTKEVIRVLFKTFTQNKLTARGENYVR